MYADDEITLEEICKKLLSINGYLEYSNYKGYMRVYWISLYYIDYRIYNFIEYRICKNTGNILKNVIK